MKQLVFLVLIVVSGCTSTGTEAPREPDPIQNEESTKTNNEVAADTDANKLICYRQKEVGTHFSRKICKTRRQIKEDRRAAEDLLDRSRTHDASQISTE